MYMYVLQKYVLEIEIDLYLNKKKSTTAIGKFLHSLKLY